MLSEHFRRSSFLLLLLLLLLLCRSINGLGSSINALDISSGGLLNIRPGNFHLRGSGAQNHVFQCHTLDGQLVAVRLSLLHSHNNSKSAAFDTPNFYKNAHVDPSFPNAKFVQGVFDYLGSNSSRHQDICPLSAYENETHTSVVSAGNHGTVFSVLLPYRTMLASFSPGPDIHSPLSSPSILKLEIQRLTRGSVLDVKNWTLLDILSFSFGYFFDSHLFSRRSEFFPTDIHPANILFDGDDSNGDRLIFFWSDFGQTSHSTTSNQLKRSVSETLRFIDEKLRPLLRKTPTEYLPLSLPSDLKDAKLISDWFYHQSKIVYQLASSNLNQSEMAEFGARSFPAAAFSIQQLHMDMQQIQTEAKQSRQTQEELQSQNAKLQSELQSQKAEFEAKLESQKAEFEAKLESQKAEFEAKLESQKAEFEAELHSKLQSQKAEFEAELHSKLQSQKAEFEAKLESQGALLQTVMAQLQQLQQQYKN